MAATPARGAPGPRTQGAPARRSRAGPRRATRPASSSAQRCRRKFLRFFPGGFADETYIAWERGYKWKAHEAWQEHLGPKAFQALLRQGRFAEVAAQAVRIESRTNLLFSFEKMAVRDAVRDPVGARRFAEGLYGSLHGPGGPQERFDAWRDVVAGLPRRKTRVLTWPLVTVFGFLAQPDRHIFLKPNVTRRAAQAYGFGFEYASRPDWSTYQSLLRFAGTVRKDLADLLPRDMIDLQSFIWVQGSDEY
ncbi:MAG TPA: hypothetical protein VM286_08885 [Candidatus Thermoplasmatota archaeon]|nr:hypothetical protein [Candidatus Thermoplasmatota archaeon]